MLSENSSLRRVHASLNRKQEVFINGLRHSAEIIALAHSRLRSTPTELALNPPSATSLTRFVRPAASPVCRMPLSHSKRLGTLPIIAAQQPTVLHLRTLLGLAFLPG